jgi:hypothetical protein
MPPRSIATILAYDDIRLSANPWMAARHHDELRAEISASKSLGRIPLLAA